VVYCTDFDVFKEFLLKFSFLKNVMGGACSAFGGQEWRIEGFGGET
jgi:hypothetical protein